MTTSESFRKEVAEKLDVVVKSLDARASVAFPSCLSAEERKYVHHLAEQFGLRHESKGRGDARFISVSKDPGKAARRNLGARNRTAEEIPKLAWPEAALEALEDPLVKHAAEGNNAQVAASSAPLQAVSPRTIDRLLQSKLPESRLKSAEPLEPPGPPATELLSVRQALPAWQCREQLLEAVQSKQVTLVIGETGCGKSTQVPQFILEACPGANILVTQPRRISALSLAHRVAQERGETVGHVVGYSVHLEHQSSPRTRLHFCTAGVARRRILETPDLPEVTHVVMDELHERDKVTDFLLIAIRDLLARRPELRIILMSATMQHETFQKYFEGCAEVQIHGRVHPVEAIYLEDLAPKLHKLGYVEHLGPGFAAGGYGYGSWDNKGNEKSFKYQVLVGQTHHPDHLCGYGANAWESLEGRRKDEGLFLHDVLQQTKGVLYDLPIIEALLDVLQQEPKEVNGRTNGGILIFLPGWDDIDRLLKRLTKVLPSGQFRILPLHSQIRLEQQKEVFQVPPQGVRKIVLSTNIAETAITIDDIDTVIDCGRAKETSYDAFLRVPTLNTSWISKASASQRRGRAGRTKPGVCYHLYCRRRLAMLDEHRPPEMLRSALEDVCLHAKLVMTRTGQQDSLLDFLGSAPDPPEERSVRNGERLLQEIGALTCEEDSVPMVPKSLPSPSGLTALGVHLCSLPLPPQLAKTVIWANLLGVADAAIIIVSALQYREPFTSLSGDRGMSLAEANQAVRWAKWQLSPEGSDHLALLSASKGFEAARSRGGNAARQFCEAADGGSYCDAV